MIILTRAQRVALHRVYKRNPQPITYRQFRRAVTPYFDSSGCIMVKWCGMWLGIETDGYTHS